MLIGSIRNRLACLVSLFTMAGCNSCRHSTTSGPVPARPTTPPTRHRRTSEKTNPPKSR